MEHERPAPPTRASARRVLTSGLVGNFAEWYDYTLFGFAAAYLGTTYFPSENPTVSLLFSFATFAVTFFVRPLGGVLFGALADRLGRQRILVVVILGISGATFVVGLLPGYASIGVAAPILLVALRLVQGVSAGGEMGSSLSFLAEHAPPTRRGLFVSTLNIGACLGGLTSSGIFAILAASLPEGAMAAWGWRIPFLLAGPLGLAAYYIRSRLDETPEFQAIRRAGETTRRPVREAMRSDRRAIVQCFLFTMTESLGFYMIIVYFPSVLSPLTGGPSAFAYLVAPLGYVGGLVALPLTSHLSDRVGRRSVLYGTCIGYIVLAVPTAMLMHAATLWSTVLGAFVFGFVMGTSAGGPFAAMAEMFPTRTRATSFSIAYNVAVALFGGLAPIYLTFLVGATGSPLAPAVCLVAAAVVSLVALRGVPDRAGLPLEPDHLPAPTRSRTDSRPQ